MDPSDKVGFIYTVYDFSESGELLIDEITLAVGNLARAPPARCPPVRRAPAHVPACRLFTSSPPPVRVGQVDLRGPVQGVQAPVPWA